MLGSATFTTLTSSTTMNCAASIRPSTVHGRRTSCSSVACGAGAAWIAWDMRTPGGFGVEWLEPRVDGTGVAPGKPPGSAPRPPGRRSGESRRFHRRGQAAALGACRSPVQPRASPHRRTSHAAHRHRPTPSTSSSSAPARPASPRPTTSSSAACGSSSSTPPPRSATPGAPGGTRCGSSRRRSTTGCPGMAFPAPAGHLPDEGRGRGLPRGVRPSLRPARPAELRGAAGLTRLRGGFAVAHQPGPSAGPPGRGRHRPVAEADRPCRVPTASATPWSSCTARPTATRTDLPPGHVVVVGAGNSGRQIALELAATHHVTLAVGTESLQLPQRAPGPRPVLVADPARRGHQDRPVAARPPDAGPRGPGDRHAAPCPAPGRGQPPLAGDAPPDRTASSSLTARVARPSTVVWATGFARDYSWIDVPGVVDRGTVLHHRGITEVPGLSFIGLPWQHTRGSSLLGFVQHDAAWLIDRITAGSPRTSDRPDVLAAVRSGGDGRLSAHAPTS